MALLLATGVGPTIQSQYRAFTKQRIARRKAGGGNEANSERGLAALDFVNHDLPQLHNTEVLKKVLLSDLPLGYHTRDGINSFHIAASRSNGSSFAQTARPTASMRSATARSSRIGAMAVGTPANFTHWMAM